MNEILSKLVQENALDEEGARIVHDGIAHGKPFDDALRDAPNLVEDKALRVLAAEFDLPYVDLEKDAEKYVREAAERGLAVREEK